MLKTTWGPFFERIMQRLTARFLLLFAFVGIFLPIALQATAPPPHACCRRKSAHHCHNADESEQPEFSSRACCTRNRARAVTISQRAHPNASIALSSDCTAGYSTPHSNASALLAMRHASQSPRAPPRFFLA
jgi:hypothetical protein